MRYTGPVQPGPTDDGGWRINLLRIRTRTTVGRWYHPTAQWGGMHLSIGRFTHRSGWWIDTTDGGQLGWAYESLDRALGRLWLIAADHGAGWTEAPLRYTPTGQPVYAEGPW